MTFKRPFMLWIVFYLLLKLTTSLDCIEFSDLDQEQLIYYNKIEEMYSNNLYNKTDFFLRIVEKGMVFVHPDDADMEIRIHHYDTHLNEQILLNEYDNIKTLDDADLDLEDNARFAQRVFNVFCTINDKKITFIMELERFRDDVLTGMVKDLKLRNYLLDFNNRLEFYKSLAAAFQKIYSLGLKHCGMTPGMVLYKKSDDDFDEFPLPETDEPYIFVITGVVEMTALDKLCGTRAPKFLDHDEARKNRSTTSKCQQKVEVFTLGMVMVAFETTIFTVTYDVTVSRRSEELQKLFDKLGNTTEELEIRFSGNEHPILTFQLIDIANQIFAMMETWNLRDDIEEEYGYSYSKLKLDLVYLFNGNCVTFAYGQVLTYTKFRDHEKAQVNLVNMYIEFYKVILGMCESNDYVNGRPTQEEVFSKLTKVQTSYNEILGSLQERRNIRLV